MKEDNSFSLAIQVKEQDGKQYISVKSLKPERFTHYGFGTFLENIDPAEISITREALDILLAGQERSGLQGLEFWADNRLAWANPTSNLLVSPDHINIPKGARKWIREMTLVK